MRQDAFAASCARLPQRAPWKMPTPKDQRRTTAVIILGILGIAALLLIANGTPAGAVKDVLAIVLPPLVAIAAQSERKK